MLQEVIKNDYILPQNSYLNGSTRMDAENYYIQAGDLLDIKFLNEKLK